MEKKFYRVGDLKKIIAESSNEFKPVLGPNVESDNKKNNEKSYKDAEKNAKDFDGGLQDAKKGELPEKQDANRTTLEYNPITDPSDEQKKNIEAQAQGYTSALEKNNGIEKAAEFDNDGKIMKRITTKSDELNKEKEELAKSGLQGSKLTQEPKKKLYKENIKAKRLIFKHSRFLNEANMLSKIPEEYKKDGQTIYMKDSADNEYIVECVKSEKSGMIETNVVKYNNITENAKQVDRIKELMGESVNNYGPTSYRQRIDEKNNFQEMMDLARNK